MRESEQALHFAGEKLDSAFEKLQQALYQIVAAPVLQDTHEMQAREEGFRKQYEALQDENFQLREENATLHAELQRVQEAYDDLMQRSQRVARKMEQKALQLELMA